MKQSAGTQEDQDETDADARKKAMKELVQSWMDRLQLISVIVGTSFHLTLTYVDMMLC